MPYKKVVTMELSEIVRRIKDGQSISEISRVTGRDRKTIRKYISLIKQESFLLSEELPLDKLLSIADKSRRPPERQNIFEPYTEEKKGFLSDKAV